MDIGSPFGFDNVALRELFSVNKEANDPEKFVAKVKRALLKLPLFFFGISLLGTLLKHV